MQGLKYFFFLGGETFITHRKKLWTLSGVKWSLAMLNIKFQTEESPPALERQSDPPLCRNHQTLWPEYSGKGRREGEKKKKTVSTLFSLGSFACWTDAWALKEKRGEVTGSIGHILTNTIDLSVMGLLRAARALFSQKKGRVEPAEGGPARGRWEPRSNTLSARCDDTRGVDSNVMSEPREGRMSRWRISIGKELRIVAKQTYKSSLVSVHGWKKCSVILHTWCVTCTLYPEGLFCRPWLPNIWVTAAFQWSPTNLPSLRLDHFCNQWLGSTHKIFSFFLGTVQQKTKVTSVSLSSSFWCPSGTSASRLHELYIFNMSLNVAETTECICELVNVILKIATSQSQSQTKKKINKK